MPCGGNNAENDVESPITVLADPIKGLRKSRCFSGDPSV
jgi:hypothetical protein